MSERPSTTVSFLRCLAWLAVLAWCALPLLWAVVMLIGNARQPEPPPGPFGPRPDAGMMFAGMFGGAGILFTMFMYSAWCACGVVCGAGVDRAIGVGTEIEDAIRRWREG